MDLKMIEYKDITSEMLGTKRQRPMYLSKFTQFRESLDMKNYPRDPHEYTQHFIEETDRWINAHQLIKYVGLETFARRDAILGTTHQLDELHYLHKHDIAVRKGEYKYHRRLTDFKLKEISYYKELTEGDVFVASYPSNITAGKLEDMENKKLLDHCYNNNIPVHIDGAWFGQCRNFEFDVSHPAIHSVSVSLSKALGMGSQRIGIRYTRERVNGPVAVMNDFNYANVSDMWIGVEAMRFFGVDYWWSNYGELYNKVCTDFGLTASDSIHVAWYCPDAEPKRLLGIRTPLRFLIEGVFDARGTDLGLNEIERNERKE
jgi:hypothetical protein